MHYLQGNMSSKRNALSQLAPGNSHWLDRHIIEQANHYGISPAQKAALFDGAAEFDELIEQGLVEEPSSNRD